MLQPGNTRDAPEHRQIVINFLNFLKDTPEYPKFLEMYKAKGLVLDREEPVKPEPAKEESKVEEMKPEEKKDEPKVEKSLADQILESIAASKEEDSSIKNPSI